MSLPHDDPDITREEDLKRYGKKIKRELDKARRNGYNEPPIDFVGFRQLSIAKRKELSICELGIKTRVSNSLEKRKNVLYIWELLEISYLDILELDNCGKSTVGDLVKILIELELLDQWDYPILEAD